MSLLKKKQTKKKTILTHLQLLKSPSCKGTQNRLLVYQSSHPILHLTLSGLFVGKTNTETIVLAISTPL